MIRAGIVAATGSAVLVLGAGALIESTDESSDESTAVVPAVAVSTEAGAHDVAPPYPRNAAGETYGSAGGAATPDEEPDLILVQATSGAFGYVRKVDLDLASGAHAVSNADLANVLAATPADGLIPVYDREGTTQIGTFQAVS
ncbi:MAG: hypothetical protein ACK5IM_04815 [Demequina sp.]|uniref:hypothetical protein n=1 Tax=Demequina sp. TaxID=2050685 RepID=UPI003A89030F